MTFLMEASASVSNVKQQTKLNAFFKRLLQWCRGCRLDLSVFRLLPSCSGGCTFCQNAQCAQGDILSGIRFVGAFYKGAETFGRTPSNRGLWWSLSMRNAPRVIARSFPASHPNPNPKKVVTGVEARVSALVAHDHTPITFSAAHRYCHLPVQHFPSSWAS